MTVHPRIKRTKRTRSWVRLILLMVLLAGVYGIYLYLKPASTTVKQDAALSIGADLLLDAYLADEQQADRLYLGKVMEVSGEVLDVEGIGQSINVNLATDADFGLVVCGFDKKEVNLDMKTGELVRIVGMCDGFTGIDVQLSKCRIVE